MLALRHCRLASTVNKLQPHRTLASATDRIVATASPLPSCQPSTASAPVSDQLQTLFSQLRLQQTPAALHLKHIDLNREYKLPSLSNHQKTILDPINNLQTYKLPTNFSVITEKLTPGLIHITPIKDPHPLQSIINEHGTEVVKKECMPYLVRIRKRKMKKHKLRKLRKRMIFLNRKLTEIKARKKEKLMREYESMWAKRATDFDANKWVDGRLVLARKGGYHIDIWKEYRQQKPGSNVEI